MDGINEVSVLSHQNILNIPTIRDLSEIDDVDPEYIVIASNTAMHFVHLRFIEDHFEGKAIFHENEYKVNIHAEVDKKRIKVPFPVMGVTENEILVRISGPSGVYVQDYIPLSGESEWIEIESDSIFYEVANNQGKFDTMEIFVK